MGRFYITGFSARYGCWMCETLEAKSLAAAKQKFAARFPGLKRITAYTLREA